MMGWTMRCDIAATHGATTEIDPADLSRVYVARLKERFANPPLTTDGMVCDDCAQWLNLRQWGLVDDV
ncbi:hypothetical protein [Streptomyces sp. NPDC050392]|uniref:hypothetical protein n=1 Tax=Streptomyces sp. NPDC050392 TaxID=3155782 RepID=UPI003428540A